MNTARQNNKCNSYHHGNLRNALITAAAELIRENGSVEFAMIDAARRAGVSSAAPYRHFKDRDALLEAVSQVGFMALSEATGSVAETVPAGTEESIIAQGQAYIRFVTGHPEFYDLMWGDLGLRTGVEEEAALKTTGFHLLVDTVQAWCENAELGDFDALELGVKLWAMAHGLACLALNRHVERFMPEADVYTLLESSTHTFLDGLRKEG